MKTQHNDRSSSLIFSEKTPDSLPDDDQRLFFLVRLHMYAGSVPRGAENIDCAPAHRISTASPQSPFDEDFPIVHRISGGILSVVVDDDRRAVEDSAERVARNSVDGDISSFQTATDVSLPVYVIQSEIRFARDANLFVEFFK